MIIITCHPNIYAYNQLPIMLLDLAVIIWAKAQKPPVYLLMMPTLTKMHPFVVRLRARDRPLKSSFCPASVDCGVVGNLSGKRTSLEPKLDTVTSHHMANMWDRALC